MKIKMVLVKWYDARLYPDTYSKEDSIKHNMCIFKSLGYLISENKVTTRIAGESTNEGSYRNIILIPTGSIISIKKLFLE